MKKMDIIVTIVAVFIAMVMMSCSKNSSHLDVEDLPTAPAEPTFYWPNEAGSMDVYDDNGNVIIKNVAFTGWTLEATKEQSYVASSGATGFPTIDIEAVEGNHKIDYIVAGEDASYEVKVGSLTREYNKKTLLPLHDLVLVVIKSVLSSETSPIFKEHVEITTVLSWKKSDGSYVDYNSATTNIFVAEQVVPMSVTAIGPKKVRINFNDGTSKEESAIFGLTAGGSSETEDDNGLVLANTEAEGKAEIASFSYATKNQSFSDNVAIEGTLSYDYTYNGVKYELQFTNDFVVVADWKVLINEKEGFSFYESSETNYTLVAVEEEDRISLANDKSNFVVWQKKSEPEPADPKPLYWYQDIKKMIVVYDDNSTEDKDNKISASTEDKSWTGDKDLEMTGNTSKPASKTMYISTNYGNIKVNLSALIALGGDIDYDGHKIPCKSEFIVEAGTPVLVSNGKEGFDYHKVFNVPIVVKTKTNEEIKEVASCTSKVTISKEAAKITLVETIVNYVHKFFRTAIVDKQNITIICDNSAVFTDVMSDKSEVKAGEVSYTVKHNFVVDGVLKFNVGNINEVANKSGYFTEGSGSFNIQSKNFSVTEVSSEVSEVTFRNQAYSAPMCVVTPHKWETNDKGDMLTLTFVDENGTPCATANIGMEVKCIIPIAGNIVRVDVTRSHHGNGANKYEAAFWAMHCVDAAGNVVSYKLQNGKATKIVETSAEKATPSASVKDLPYALAEQNAVNNWKLVKVEATEIEKDSYRIIYRAMDGTNVFSLGDGETSIDDKYSNPVMHKNLEPTNGCWTIEIGNDTYNFASQN